MKNNIQSLATDPRLFDLMQHRWNATQENGFGSIDPMLVALLPLFNRLPGVSSIFSCSSHLREEVEEWDASDAAFYLLSGYELEGLVVLHRLMTWMDAHWPKGLRRRLTMQLTCVSTRGLVPGSLGTLPSQYNAVRFGYRFNDDAEHESNRKWLIDFFEHAVRCELAEQGQGR